MIIAIICLVALIIASIVGSVYLYRQERRERAAHEERKRRIWADIARSGKKSVWSLGILIASFSFFMPGAQAQFHGVNLLEYCWTTSGGTDSTIYAAILSAAATTKPTRIHFFDLNNSGAPFAVTVSGGHLRAGPCSTPGTDSIIVNLEQILIDNDTIINYLNLQLSDNDTIINLIEINNLDNDTIILNLIAIVDSLAQIITNTQEPQICECVYSLDLDNHVYSIQPNQKYPTWTYDRVVTRDCGAGVEEIFRQSGAKTLSGSSKAFTDYLNNASTYLVDGEGVIDSFRVFLKNPDTTFFIYLSPSKVDSEYPNLIIQGLDTADLRFNAAAPETMAAAIEQTVTYALNNFALTYSPPLPPPLHDFDAQVLATGSVKLRFYIYHEPTSTYAAINTAAASRTWTFSPSYAVDTTIVGTALGAISGVVTAYYNLPCDTTISVTYSDQVTDSGLNWYTVSLDDPANPALSGGVGTGTCTQACPETPDCVSICNDVTNPVPVTVTDTCLVQNILEFPVTASSNSVALASNLYHGVTVSVTTGTVVISLNNSGTITSATFSAGQTFSVRAADCELLKTGFGINATSGAAIVSTIR